MTDNHLLLYRLSELMLEHEQHQLPVDMLFDDSHIGDFVKSIQIDSPYQQMLIEGVLTESVRDEKLYVAFTVEGYFHFVLGEVIFNQTKDQSAEALKIIVEENKLKGVREGVEQCLIREIQNNNLRRLIWLIDYCGKEVEIFTIPLSNAFLICSRNLSNRESQLDNKEITKIIRLIIRENTENDLIVLENVLEFLDSKSQNILIKNISEVLLREIKANDTKRTILLLSILNYKDHKFKIRYANKLIGLNPTQIDKESAYFYFFRANLLADIYRFDLAIKEFELSIKTLKQLTGNHKNNLGSCYNNIALLKSDLGNFREAINLVEKSKKISNKEGNYIYLNNYGTISMQMGNPKLAINNFSKCLEIKLKVFGPYHDQVQLTYNNLAAAFCELADYQKAEYYFTESLKICNRIYPKVHESVASTLNNLASVKLIKDDIQESKELYERALKMRISIFGEYHELTANSFLNMSSVFINAGEFKKAQLMLKKALKINQHLFGKDSIQTIDALNAFGKFHNIMGDFKKSLHYFELMKNVCEKNYGNKHPKTQTAYNNIALLFDENGDTINALKFYKKSIHLCLQLFGNSHPKLATSLNNIGLFYKKKNRYSIAEKYYLKSLFIRKNCFGENHTETATLYNNLGVLYSDTNKNDKSISYHLKALQIRENIYGDNHDDTSSSLNNLASAYFKAGNYSLASEMITRAYSGLLKLYGESHLKVEVCAGNCSVILQESKNYKGAIYYLNIELGYLNKKKLSKTAEFQNLKFELGTCYLESGEIDLAIEQFLNLIYLNPKAKFYKYLALCYEKINNINLSLDYRIKAIELEKENNLSDVTKLNQYIDDLILFAKKYNRLKLLPDWIVNL
jgi:tetratricopeptide (TPR) repeat protein